MSNLLGTLLVKMALDAADFGSGLKSAEGALQSTGAKMQDIGGKLTLGVTTPLVGMATAAVMFANDYNASLANIASLGVPTDRIEEFKGAIQEMAVEVGKMPTDLSEGMYQIVSAFGDTGDSMEILDINARAAAAGIATTLESINLTSAVTKGYGDTSAEAVQKVADLAFETVRLGQTTFPELAASMGKVVPMAASLGVSQEELFAQMATLTGVTGNAAEVSTQLRATYQAFLQPTSDMARAIDFVSLSLERNGELASGPLVDNWRKMRDLAHDNAIKVDGYDSAIAKLDKTSATYKDDLKALESKLKDSEKAQDDLNARVQEAAAALGPAIIESVGLNEALSLIANTAGGNTDKLGGMFGSVEALNAVLALSGPQADTFAMKLAEMGDVTGAVDDAFVAQTEGVNASGFSMAQAAAQAVVLQQKLGDGIAPALGKLLTMAEPLVDWLIDMADQFANADAETQGWIVGIGAVIAAAGPVIGIIGTLVSTVGTIVGAFGGASAIASGLGAALAALGGPVTLAIAAVAGLVVAWNTDFLGMRTTIEGWMGDIGEAWPGFVGGLGQAWNDGVAWMQDAWSDTATNLESAWSQFADWLPKDAAEMSARTQEVFATMGAGIEEAFKSASTLASNVWGKFAEWLGVDVETLNQITVEAMKNTAAQITDGLIAALGLWNSFTDGLKDAWQGALDTLKSAWDGFAGWISGAVQGVGDTIGGIWDTTTGFFGGLWNGGDEAQNTMGGGLAMAGTTNITITQNFYGPSDAPSVRGASRDGVLDALRQIGGR